MKNRQIRHSLLYLVYCITFLISNPMAAQLPAIDHIVLKTDRSVLNPVLEPGTVATLRVEAVLKGGRITVIPSDQVVFSVTRSNSSGNAEVVRLTGNKVVPAEGGIATITAIYSKNGQTLKASTDMVVRPYYRDYHQTLVMKLMMGMEGRPVERLQKEPLFQGEHEVIYTFEQALDLIRKTDQLTNGIPKIVYLVGWQQGGHDHQYPSWEEVNPRLKRAQDKTALESLRWLIKEARNYHTTVSLHINMVDAYRHSPYWQEYVDKDLIARDENGKLLVAGIQIQGDSMYHVSYTREWTAGLGQRRIDRLIEMIPELKEGKTIHVDVFIAKGEHEETISLWHAKPENGKLTIDREVETQRKIFRYWREKGFDVTGEGIFWAHPLGEGFTGLQPMSWWYPGDTNYQMEIPEQLSARGRTHRSGDGDFRYGSSMHGEELFLKKETWTSAFFRQFCRTTLPRYYLSRLGRVAEVEGVLYYTDGVRAGTENGHQIIRQGDFVLRDNDDFFVPVLWKNRQLMAYSEQGYQERKWHLPPGWQGVRNVDVYRVGVNGTTLHSQSIPVKDKKITISVSSGEALLIVPAGVAI